MSSLSNGARALTVVLAALSALGGSAARAAPGASTSPRARAAPPLRVCADPNNLPFSSERRDGIENRLATLVAAELGRPLEYVWRAQRRGFFREGLGEGRCDAVMGAPAGFELALTTRPYYRSTYVFAVRRGGADVSSFDDPRLSELTVGVQLPGDAESATPPAVALARRGLAANVRGYSLYGDYREPNPPARVLDALARGEIDLAAVWGPLAGWYARGASVPLEVRPVTSIEPDLPMTFGISVAVRKGDRALRDAIDEVLERRRAEIARLLDEYGVPRPEAPSRAPAR